MSRYEISITQSFTFHAAHMLDWHAGKCSNLHGHTYRVDVSIDGKLNENGVVIDFDELSPLLNEAIFDHLDHSYLNETLTNPTAENLALHIMDSAERIGVELASVRVWETPDASATVNRK